MMKTTLFFVMVAFYLIAGINHFVNPKAYYGLFPPYLKQYALQLNVAAGVAEVALALLLFFPSVRPFAGYGIIAMLVAFIPAHIYMIQKGDFPMFGFTVTPAISVVRLVVFQPLLAYWAYYVAIKP
ncbi:MAG: MauE/DoxX family redox-associated membrane protein [Flammeovirgaceae bacterium]